MLKLTLDITIFHCYITEGTLGIQSRFLDVTIIVGKSRVYSNKGVRFMGSTQNANWNAQKMGKIEKMY